MSLPRAGLLSGATRAGVYRIDRFEFDLEREELRSDGAPVELSRNARRVLAYLIRNRGRTVDREELMQELWPDVVVGEGSLTQAIWEARRALGDRPSAPRFIVTRYGQGYGFVGNQ
jgi:DNA-binding winged helix-turn-helix (wHTH) protein